MTSATIAPSVIKDLDSIPFQPNPIVPTSNTFMIIAIEIMRGCPHLCRFCQSTVIKRPLRIREVDTVGTARESYQNRLQRD